MYIRKQDSSYLERIYKTLDEAKRKVFLEILLKEGSKGSERDISKIKVVGDEIYDVQGVEQEECITRTMVKKAYKAAKEEKAI